MLGKPRILSLFCSLFNKFINTGACMLDSFYHMVSKLLKNHIFMLQNIKILPLLSDVKMVIIT